MTIDYLTKGAVINPHNVLSGRSYAVNITALTPVVYYYIKEAQLDQMSECYPAMAEALSKAREESCRQRVTAINPLDYHLVNVGA